MEIIKRMGRRVNLKCDMCGVQGYGPKETYEWTPPAQSISGTPNMIICAKCARRALGSKNVRKWRELHE